MIQIQNLCKSFNKETVNENIIFDNFSMDIEEGDFITIIGSNGAGKSTLLNSISGLIEVDKGSIKINDLELTRLPEHKRTKIIGRVFQNPTDGNSPSMTILENLSLAYNKGKKYNLSLGITKKHIPKFKEILSLLSLGLEDKLNDKVGNLSGGQRQALSLIMATISNPKILLLDEHTAALDPKTSETIIELTKEIISKQNITTLMVTHNLNQAISIGNRLLMLHEGKIILDIKGKEKESLTIDTLLDLFEEANSKDIISDRILFS